MQAVEKWLTEPDPATFPYSEVVGEFHRHGKHFVGKDLLAALDAARTVTTEPALSAFLDSALDKWDGRYDYLTYLALSVLPLPGRDGGSDVEQARLRRDRLVALLVADIVRFEDAVAAGDPALPLLRPDPSTTGKRRRLAERVVAPVARRLGVTGDLPAVAEAVRAQLPPAEREAIGRSMLPVYTAHDEYLFIRVLQSFEATFAQQAVELRAAVTALTAGDAPAATGLVCAATAVLREAAPLFSLMATMQVEAFRLFRQYTEGASAIQSVSYKTVESLCRRPGDDRLDSLAYRSVPGVRRQILEEDPPTLSGALAAGRVSPEDARAVLAATAEFGEAMGRWRQTHYRLAVRMLGDRGGTGSTEGTPYLRKVLDVPVFTADRPPG